MGLLDSSVVADPSTTFTHSTTTRKTTVAAVNTLNLLFPAVANTFYFCTVLQRLLSTTTIFVVFRCYLLTLLVLRQWHVLTLHSINVWRLLLLHSIYATRILIIHSSWASFLLVKQLVWGLKKGWKTFEPLRQKLFFELMAFLLGSGNAVLLLVFWPGWLFIGGTACGVWFALS
jgi:hypothetical protein